MQTEVVYLGHDNQIRLQLKASSSAVALSSVTQINVRVGDTLIASSSATAGSIIWSGSSFSTGEVRLVLGGNASLAEGNYDVPVVVYDATYPSGVVWDTIPMRVYSDVESIP